MPTKKVLLQKDNNSQLLTDIRKSVSFHHALLLIAGNNRNEISAQITQEWKELSSDLVIVNVDQFTIDDARAIKKTATEKSYQTYRLFVISFSRITAEAQNAMLKSIEDPSSSTKFIFVCEQLTGLLPTFLSRVQKINTSQHFVVDDSVLKEAKEFIDAPIKKRLALAKTYAEKVSDEKLSRNYVAQVLYHIISMQSVRDKQTLDLIEYVTDRASSVKMIFEHIALIV